MHIFFLILLVHASFLSLWSTLLHEAAIHNFTATPSDVEGQPL